MKKRTKCDQWIKILVGTEESAGAVIRRCSVNKAFWRIAENSLRKYLNQSIFLMTLQALRLATLLKSNFSKDVFTWILKNNYLRTAASESVRYLVYILLSECHLEEGKEYKTEDNPWMFQRVSCSREQWFCEISYKYESCKHTKTKSCYKNVSCWFICSSIFLFFHFCGDLKFDLMFFMQLIWWIRALQIFKKFDQTKMFQILLHTLPNFSDSTNLIKLIWPCISSHLSIVHWFKKLSDLFFRER